MPENEVRGHKDYKMTPTRSEKQRGNTQSDTIVMRAIFVNNKNKPERSSSITSILHRTFLTNR